MTLVISNSKTFVIFVIFVSFVPERHSPPDRSCVILALK
jgi:hypothetical protein